MVIAILTNPEPAHGVAVRSARRRQAPTGFRVGIERSGRFARKGDTRFAHQRAGKRHMPLPLPGKPARPVVGPAPLCHPVRRLQGPLADPRLRQCPVGVRRARVPGRGKARRLAQRPEQEPGRSVARRGNPIIPPLATNSRPSTNRQTPVGRSGRPGVFMKVDFPRPAGSMMDSRPPLRTSGKIPRRTSTSTGRTAQNRRMSPRRITGPEEPPDRRSSGP